MPDTNTIQTVKQALSDLKDPELGRSIAKTDQIGDVTLDAGKLKCHLKLSTHSWPIRQHFAEQAQDAIRGKLPDISDIDIQFDQLDRPPAPLGQIGLSVKSVIAVGSGKGGVGKSTLAASIALTLLRSGAKVGLMDADVYGPSVPHLLGLSGRPEVQNGKVRPIYFEHMPVMSMGFLIEADQPVIWRGPMLHGAIAQFLRDTFWGPLDYLIIDMPPGTGDIALTLSQLVPLTGAVVVCTPQQVALLDAVKAIAMFKKTNIPILGVVENMSGFICPDCGKRYDIFGSGGARAKAEELQVPFLGEVPLNIQLRQQSDTGNLSDALSDPICSSSLEKIVQSLLLGMAVRAAATPHGAALPVL
jgi:ATP-binding protein involved in chromosome partitioning